MSYPNGSSGGGEYVDPITGQTGSYGQPSQPYGQPSQAYGAPSGQGPAQGYGQPSGQGPAQGYGGSFYQGTTYSGGLYGGGEPPKGNKKPLIIAALAAVVLLAVGAIVWVLVGSSDDEEPVAEQPLPAPSSESTPPSTDASGGTGSGSDNAVVPAATPGWQGVYVPKEKIAYDVPKKDWKVATPGTISGWEDAHGKPTAVFHGVSNYLDEWCPGDSGSARATIGVQHANVSPEKSARGYVIFFGAAIQEKPFKPENVDESKGVPVKIAGGKMTGTMSSAIVPIKYDKNTPKKCQDAKNTRITAVAFDPKLTKDKKTGKDDIPVVIVVSDLGGKQELAKSDIDKIISSIRPAPTKPTR